MHPNKNQKEVINLSETFILIDNQPYKRHDLEEKELDIIASLVKILDRITRGQQRQKVRLVLQTNFSNNNSIFIIMAINLNANQFSVDTLGLIDSDSGNPVTATFDTVTFTSSDPTIFTTTQDTSNPNQTRNQAVAAGSASLAVTANATYTDSVSGQSVTKSLTLNVPVTIAATTAGENVALVINQGTPQTV